MAQFRAWANEAPNSERWLTVADAAERASVSKDTIYQACLREELQHVRVGGRRTIRLRAEWVDVWLERDVRLVKASVLTDEDRKDWFED